MGLTTLLTAEEAAEYLRVNVNTLRRYIREGRISAAKVGRGYRIKQEELDAFLKRHTTGADEADNRPSAEELAEPDR